MTGIELEAALTAFPRSRLCDFATPVHRLPRLERKLNTCPLYIKRDDLNGVGSGGNKVRPLEYLLGEAQAQGCDVVIASGQENSNLCSIAASACCRLGIKCILVHNNDQPTHLAGNILLNKLSGVEEHYVGTIPETERNVYVEELTERLRQEGKKPFVVENGATSVHAAVGSMNGGRACCRRLFPPADRAGEFSRRRADPRSVRPRRERRNGSGHRVRHSPSGCTLPCARRLRGEHEGGA